MAGATYVSDSTLLNSVSIKRPLWLRERTRSGLGIIQPSSPSPAKAPPSGPGWLHEIKHDGFRILARKDSAGVRLITRAGNAFSDRFPFIAMAVSRLPVRSCLIDGEAIVCDETDLAVFELIRRRHGAPASAVHCAFDLLELDGRDLRREPIEERKRLLAKLLSFTGKPASSVARALSANGLARLTVRAAQHIGSKSKIR